MMRKKYKKGECVFALGAIKQMICWQHPLMVTLFQLVPIAQVEASLAGNQSDATATKHTKQLAHMVKETVRRKDANVTLMTALIYG